MCLLFYILYETPCTVYCSTVLHELHILCPKMEATFSTLLALHGICWQLRLYLSTTTCICCGSLLYFYHHYKEFIVKEIMFVQEYFCISCYPCIISYACVLHFCYSYMRFAVIFVLLQ